LLAVDEDLGVLGELVHVDDVREHAKLMERLERAPALEAGLEAEQARDRGLEGLDRLVEVEEVGALDVDQGDERDRWDQEQEDGGGDARPKRQVAPADSGATFDALAGDGEQLFRDAAQARAREPLVDPAGEGFDARDQLMRVEFAVHRGEA
jgi:hypothetical protein